MKRVTQFAFRVNSDERRAIAGLAVHLQRSQSDAVRFVVVAAAKELGIPVAMIETHNNPKASARLDE